MADDRRNESRVTGRPAKLEEKGWRPTDSGGGNARPSGPPPPQPGTGSPTPAKDSK